MNRMAWLMVLFQNFLYPFVEKKPPVKNSYKDIELTCQMLQGKFNTKKYERIIEIALLIFIWGFIIILFDIPRLVHGELILRQKMPEMIYIDTELKNVLQDVVNSSYYKLHISACRDLAEKRITVDIKKGTRIEDVLKKLCRPPDCKLTIWRGIDVQFVLPLFECTDTSRPERVNFSKSVDTKKH